MAMGIRLVYHSTAPHAARQLHQQPGALVGVDVDTCTSGRWSRGPLGRACRGLIIWCLRGADRGIRRAHYDSLDAFDDITAVEREDPTSIRSSEPSPKITRVRCNLPIRKQIKEVLGNT